jgi:hypothetical protein
MTSATPSFEVQLYRKARWETSARYDDLPAAEAMAKSLQLSPTRVEGVRIIRETFDARTNRFVTSVVWRWLRGESEQREAARQAKEVEGRVERVLQTTRAARLAAEQERLRRRQAWKPKLPFWFVPFVGAVLAALAGIGGLIGLHSLIYS